MTVRITPIENPKSPLMKLAYWLTKRRLGKVISPLKTLYVRMPLSFSMWVNKITGLEQQLAIPEELVLLVKIHVAQLNGCGFCIDIGKALAIEKFEDQEKFLQVGGFEESPLYSEKEKLALRFATELTLRKRVTDQTYSLCQEIFSDEELISIAWATSVENYYNLMNGAFRLESDGLCSLPKANKPAQAVSELHP